LADLIFGGRNGTNRKGVELICTLSVTLEQVPASSHAACRQSRIECRAPLAWLEVRFGQKQKWRHFQNMPAVLPNNGHSFGLKSLPNDPHLTEAFSCKIALNSEL
jgi:hypothetical protein